MPFHHKLQLSGEFLIQPILVETAVERLPYARNNPKKNRGLDNMAGKLLKDSALDISKLITDPLRQSLKPIKLQADLYLSPEIKTFANLC